MDLTNIHIFIFEADSVETMSISALWICKFNHFLYSSLVENNIILNGNQSIQKQESIKKVSY